MNKKVLLVEDSPTQAIQTRALLENKGYSVTLANDGVNGVELALAVQPDLVVLDVSLAKLNGFEVCKLLKSNLQLRTIPVIMFSRENRLKNMVTAYEMGADYYVVKSDEGEKVLILLIETVLSRLSHRLLQPS